PSPPPPEPTASAKRRAPPAPPYPASSSSPVLASIGRWFASTTTPPSAPDVARHPLAEPAYRAMWSAYVLANVGVWIQTVGAAWLMTTLTSDALPVALVQTATTLPALVIGLPAGSLGDRVDRRRLVLATQAWMVVSATPQQTSLASRSVGRF